MKCLSRESIQEYIDQETLPEGKTEIELHLAECLECKMLYDDVIKSLDRLGGVLEFVSPVEQEIVEFKLNHTYRGVGIRRIIEVVSAAVIISFIAMLYTRNSKNNAFIDLQYDMSELYIDEDPNRLWHDGASVISLIQNDTIIVLTKDID